MVGNEKDELALSYTVHMVVWLRIGEKGVESSLIYIPAMRMWLYVLYDNQLKTNCNSSSKKRKKKNLHAPDRFA